MSTVDPNQEPESGAGVGTETASPQGGEEMIELRRQLGDAQEQNLRTRAEFVNYQKRTKEQSERDKLYAAGPLAIDLIAVLDNFERAAEAARASGNSSIVEGLEMVHRQLLAALAKHGIVPIDALGQPFDPNLHEALLQQPVADKPEGTVVAELGKGYRLRDRVLRPTKVAVSITPNS